MLVFHTEKQSADNYPKLWIKKLQIHKINVLFIQILQFVQIFSEWWQKISSTADNTKDNQKFSNQLNILIFKL